MIGKMSITWSKLGYLALSKKYMSDYFFGAATAKDLCDTLKRRYGGSNSVLLYELEKEITIINQGNKSVTQYFTELQRLLDDLVTMQSPPLCSCNAKETHDGYVNSRNVIRFFMGLNEGYTAMKD